MSSLWCIFRREFAAYFATPIAFVFLLVFLFAASGFTFYLGGYFESGQADLDIFFNFHPWLYLFFLPALSMRLWAEERRSGSIELLLSWPLPLWSIVAGKFLAAWVFAGLALALSFPLWLTANYLGEPDHGVVLAGYLGSFLMAGAYLALGCAVSASTRNQVIAFILSVLVSFLFTMAGLPLVLDFFSSWAPVEFVNLIASFSFLAHFEAISRGVIDLRDLIFFGSLILLALTACGLIVDMKRAG